MEIDEYITRCVVKILARPKSRLQLFRHESEESEVSGTGFWVLPDGHIVTCYHVVACEGREPGYVDIEYRGQRLKAIYCREKSNPSADLAVLQIRDEHVQPDYVILGRTRVDMEARSFGYRKVEGYREGEGFREGFLLTGMLRPGQSFAQNKFRGEIYNLDTTLTREPFETFAGMSGAPVYDPMLGVVIGVQYAEDEEGRTIAYVHPIDKIYEQWPELKSRNSTTLLAKLRELENQTSRELTEFGNRKLAIPYPERKADMRLREMLAEPAVSQAGLWIVRGEAGVGKSTLLLRLAKWCEDKGRHFPIWLDQSYFQRDGERFSQFLDSSPKDWGARLQDFARLVRKPLVLFIDALDVILPHTDAAKLVSQLNELGSNVVVICTSRPFELERLRDAAIPAGEVIDLDQLSNEQVRLVLRHASETYHIRIDELDPKLIQMCQNPFILNLVLESSRTETLPQMSNVTDTWIKERYWQSRIERVRPETFRDYRFGGMTKSEVGEAKAKVAHNLAARMFATQTYRLDAKAIGELQRDLSLEKIANKEIPNSESVKQAIYDELNAEGVVRLSGLISFWHDTLADFIICRQILTSAEWQVKVDWLLEHIDVPFYVPIITHLVLQARDMRQHAVEDRIYDTMITILAHKYDNQKEMNKSWGVTYALLQLAMVWINRFCDGLYGSYSQEVASTIASVLEDVRLPVVRDALIAGMKHYKYKRRFVDGLGASADPAALGPLVNLLDRLMNTREDDELLETVAVAMGKIGDKRAEPSLMRLEANDAMPRVARRNARKALYSITNLAKYSEPIPYSDEETIEGLKIQDKRDPTRPTDWKMVKRTAERIAGEVKKGVSPAVIEALHTALDHEHEDATFAVVHALSAIASETSVNRLITKATDMATPDTVRKEAVRALRNIASKETIASGSREKVRSTFGHIAREDPNPEIRHMALEAANKK